MRMVAAKGIGRTGLQPGDAKELVRPYDLFRVAIPLPAANGRKSLRFPELRLLPAQGFFRVFALGDVDARSDIAGRRAIQRQQRHARVEHPSVFAIVPREPILQLEWL